MTEFMKALIISWLGILIVTGVICYTCWAINKVNAIVDMRYLESVPVWATDEEEMDV